MFFFPCCSKLIDADPGVLKIMKVFKSVTQSCKLADTNKKASFSFMKLMKLALILV